MTKKLYLYNNICYDECPYGSIKDDVNNICIEVNHNTSINTSLNVNLFKENINKYILKYLSESANNLIDILRAYDFSNYFYNQKANENLKIDLKLPIFDFSECIEKFKFQYNLINNNLFYDIIEYNHQTDKNWKFNKNTNIINSTEYNIFLENGTILNLSFCQGINITIKKRIEMNKVDINEIKEIQDKYNVSIFDINNEQFNDYCIPFTLGNRDLTLYDRKLLLNKYKLPCDERCDFVSFNYENNYSTCICPIKIEEEKTITDAIMEEINDNDYIKLLRNSNLKFFKCFKTIKKIILKRDFIILISISFFIAIIHFILLYISCKYNKNKKNIQSYNEKQNKNSNQNNNENNNKNVTQSQNINKFSKNSLFRSLTFIENKTNDETKRYKVITSNNNIIISKNINNESNANILNQKEKYYVYSKEINIKEIKKENKKESKYNQEEYNIIEKFLEFDFSLSLKYDQRNFCTIFCDNFLKNALNSIHINKDNIKNKFEFVILILISLHSFIFINAILFSDIYISERNSYKNLKLEFIITKEYNRLIYSFFICLIIIKLLSFLIEQKKYLKAFNKCKLILAKIIITLLHISYFYFLMIFGTINHLIIVRLLISSLISLLVYFFFYVIICFIVSIFKYFSIKCKCELLFDISNFIKLLFD